MNLTVWEFTRQITRSMGDFLPIINGVVGLTSHTDLSRPFHPGLAPLQGLGSAYLSLYFIESLLSDPDYVFQYLGLKITNFGPKFSCKKASIG